MPSPVLSNIISSSTMTCVLLPRCRCHSCPQNSNIALIFSMLKKDDRTTQMCYYQAGIGTYTGYVPLTSNFLSHIQQTHIHLSRRDLHLKETRLRRRLGSQSSRQSSLSSLSHLTLPQVQDGYKFCMYRSYSALSLIPSSDAQLPQGRQDLPLWFLQRCIHRTCFGRHAS